MKIELSNTSSQRPSNFRHIFRDPIHLDRNKDYQIALSSLSMYNESPNISVSYGNNTFAYSRDNGVSFTTLTIPSGIYSIEQLDTKINDLILADGGLENKINLIPDYSILRVVLYITDSNYRLDLTTGNLRNLLGFDSAIYTTTTTAQSAADVSNGVISYNLNCSLVLRNSSYINGNRSNSLFAFVPNTSSGSLFYISPVNLEFLDINTKDITSIEVNLQDNLGRELVDLTSPVRFTLVIREKP